MSPARRRPGPTRTPDARFPPGERGSSAWREVRRFVLARDKACLLCGATQRLTVDHVRPLSMGGSDAPRNLRTLCRSCHETRHA